MCTLTRQLSIGTSCSQTSIFKTMDSQFCRVGDWANVIVTKRLKSRVSLCEGSHDDRTLLVVGTVVPDPPPPRSAGLLRREMRTQQLHQDKDPGRTRGSSKIRQFSFWSETLVTTQTPEKNNKWRRSRENRIWVKLWT